MTGPSKEPTEGTRRVGARLKQLRGWLVGVFEWHVGLFVAINVGLNAINWAAGRPWWAVWPLLVTGLLLGLHYLVYKSAVIDEQWVADRSEELNLKSYDRGHIEDLKSRYEK